MNSDNIPTNKIVLRVELIGSCTLKMSLVYLDKRAMIEKEDVTLTHSNKAYDFFMYSRNTFYLGTNSMRFPSSDNYKINTSHSRTFKNDEERYNYLKRVKNALIDWNDNFKPFKQSADYQKRRKNIIYSDEYWIL